MEGLFLLAAALVLAVFAMEIVRIIGWGREDKRK